MKFFYYIFQDMKDDLKWIGIIAKRIIKKEPIVNQAKLNQCIGELKSTSPKEEFLKTWPWLIAILFALVMGVLLSAKYYENQCNSFILDNYDRTQNGMLLPKSPLFPQLPNNVSEEYSNTQDYDPNNIVDNYW